MTRKRAQKIVEKPQFCRRDVAARSVSGLNRSGPDAHGGSTGSTLTPHTSIRRVALLIETDRAYGRGILGGVAQWMREHEPWSLHVEPGTLPRRAPPLSTWGCHGVIARASTPALEIALRELAIPAVVLGYQTSGRHVRLGTCSQREGILAAEHFLERGFRHFAFCGQAERFSAERCEGYVTRLAEAGHRVWHYRRGGLSRDQWGRGEQPRMAEWLAGLPGPVAVFAATDVLARKVLEACRWRRLRVPDQVAVLGVDNDELLCELCSPPLSSVALATRRAGFEAAAALDTMMNGGQPMVRTIVVEPIGVQTRQSTDIFAIDDPDIRAALAFIRENAHTGLGVADVLRVVPMARRSLENRFQKLLGRSPHDEILRVKLERARSLLAATDMPLANVAAAAGFSTANYMAYAFRRAVGISPREFRRRCSAPPPPPPAAG